MPGSRLILQQRDYQSREYPRGLATEPAAAGPCVAKPWSLSKSPGPATLGVFLTELLDLHRRQGAGLTRVIVLRRVARSFGNAVTAGDACELWQELHF